MEIWQEGKIKDFAEVKGGKRLPKGKQLITERNTHPYIRIRDLGKSKTLELTEDYEYVDDETQESIARYIVDEGDILISVVGTIGLIGIVGKSLHKANQTENCDKIINLKGLNRDYLYYYLISSLGQEEIKRGTVGAVQPKLPLKNVQDITIKYPSVETQEKIVAVLNAIDNKIETNTKINRNLQEQALTLFKSYFIDYEPYGGMQPDRWATVSLDDVCTKITDGSHYSPKDVPRAPYPMYSVKDMETYGFNPSSCKHIEVEELEKMKRNDCVPKKNDILVAKDGSYLKEIFMCLEERDEAILSSIAIFRPDTTMIRPEILLYLLKQPSVRKDVGDNYVSGSALPRIVLKDFKKYTFVLPPIGEQNRIGEVLSVYQSQININVEANHRLTALRDSLLPKLMSGELDVSDINI